MPDGPQDSTIPTNWEQTAGHWDGHPFGKTTSNGTETWETTRTLIGPKRLGPLVPKGKPYVSAFYKGNCAWDIILIQDAQQKEYQLYEEIDVQITRRGATVSETVLRATVPAQWRAIRRFKKYTTWRILSSIVAKDPSGLPCGADIARFGVPGEVKDAADRAAQANGSKRGVDVPVAPPKPKPKPWTGPTIGPPPDEIHPPPDPNQAPPGFWIWWGLGGWILVPDPPWEPPGGHMLPHHDLAMPGEGPEIEPGPMPINLP